MAIATTLRKIISEILKNPYALKRVIDSAERYEDLCNKKHSINKLPIINYSDIVGEKNSKIEMYTYLDGASLPTDIALLTELVKQKSDCDFLEIGCWRGETLFNVSKHAKHSVSISLSQKEMKSLGYSDAFIAQHKLFVQQAPNISFIEHNSKSFDFNTLNQKFDIIFIDGDHSYDGVVSDTKNVFNLLKNDESVIIWHDYAYTTEKVRHEVLLAILDGMPQHEHKHLYHVSNTLCAIYTKRKFDTYNAVYPANPKQVFSIELTAKRLNN
jgi:SAM-dependent methyltransferase